eukprot:GHUV01046041.1.p1 GENE.GHUV01046041.1~~GHUV01046041.1.p1  ORF type:complete len:173 (+),score=40.48 GHUV01046041.1:405-923(+)
MQTTIVQNQQHIKSLERRVTSMETDMAEHQQRARQSVAEQHKLVAEKNALIETVKRLNRELAKLEHFKKSLLQQLQDDEQVRWFTSCLIVDRQLVAKLCLFLALHVLAWATRDAPTGRAYDINLCREWIISAVLPARTAALAWHAKCGNQATHCASASCVSSRMGWVALLLP